MAPPLKRRNVAKFLHTNSSLAQEIANSRLHDERAVGAMKKWCFPDTKFSSRLFDYMRWGKGAFPLEGFHALADRGFNSIATRLMQDEIHFVAPPWKRRNVDPFLQSNASLTQKIANRRIDVQRAVGDSGSVYRPSCCRSSDWIV